jgi:hypothetical protein
VKIEGIVKQHGATTVLRHRPGVAPGEFFVCSAPRDRATTRILADPSR